MNTLTNKLFKIGKKWIAVFLILVTIMSTFPPMQQEAQAEEFQDVAVGVLSCFAGEIIGNMLTSIAGELLGGIFGGDVPVDDGVVRTFTSAEAVKDCIMDMVANALKRALVREMVKFTVNWANGGKDGDTRYGRIADKILERTKNKILDSIIYDNESLRGLCTGFELPIKFALQKSFYSEVEEKDIKYEPKCTTDKIEENIKKAAAGVGKIYSWNKFLAATTNPDNNLFGVFFRTSDAIVIKLDEAQKNLNDDKDRNKGFLSFRKCSDVYVKKRQEEKKSITYDGTNYAKRHCKITTAGTQISEQLDRALGAEGESIIAADEFDEILSQYISKFINSLFSDEGVSGLSGSAYYGQIDDTLFDQVKTLYKQSLDPDLYEVAIKVVKSRRKTIENGIEAVSEGLICWNDKRAALEEIERQIQDKIDNPPILVEGEDPNPIEYLIRIGVSSNGIMRKEKLSEQTVNIAIEKFNDVLAELNNELEKANDQIDILEISKKKVATVSEQVQNAKNQIEVNQIMKDAGVEAANIQKELNDRQIVEQRVDELINGRIIDRDNKGNEIRQGGILVMNGYCYQFRLTANALEAFGSITDFDSLPATVKRVIIDTYNPQDDLEAIKTGNNQTQPVAADNPQDDLEAINTGNNQTQPVVTDCTLADGTNYVKGNDLYRKNETCYRIYSGDCTSKNNIVYTTGFDPVEHINISSTILYPSESSCQSAS